MCRIYYIHDLDGFLDLPEMVDFYPYQIVIVLQQFSTIMPMSLLISDISYVATRRVVWKFLQISNLPSNYDMYVGELRLQDVVLVVIWLLDSETIL